MIRLNISSITARQDEEGIIHNLIYYKEYILYRDLDIIERGG